MASTEQVVLISSLGTAVTELRKVKKVVEARSVLAWYIKRRNDDSTVESKLAKVFDNDQILEAGGKLSSVLDEDPIWLSRMARQVLTPFYDSIGRRDFSDPEVTKNSAATAEAACASLSDIYGDKLPSESFEWISQQLGCSAKI